MINIITIIVNWTEESHKLFNQFIRSTAIRTGIPKHLIKKSFYQKLSFQLQKMNAAMIYKRDMKLDQEEYPCIYPYILYNIKVLIY